MKILMSVVALVACAAAHAADAPDAPPPRLYSAHAVVYDADSQQTLLEKNAKAAVPFASITKLLTAMVALDANPDMNEMLSVSDKDVDLLKHTSSRIAVGTTLSREDMLHLALMSSENRLASALSQRGPGGRGAGGAAGKGGAERRGGRGTQGGD